MRALSEPNLIFKLKFFSIKCEDEKAPKEDEKKELPKTTFWETLMHLHKANIGSGVFALGDAFSNAGLFVGTGVVVFIGLMCVYCQHMMVS